MSWTNAVITEAGHRLQAALLGTGKGLVFTRAVSGAGLAAGALEVQTAVMDERQVLTLEPAVPLEGAKARVRVLLSNTGLQTGYIMHQLGFYAKAQDGGEEILYALVQDETGDPIPSAAESPGFSVDWTYVFAYGNAADVTVTIDPSGLISWGQVGQPNGVAGLGENGAVPIPQGGTGETTVQGVVDAFGIFLAISAAAAYNPEGSYAVGDYCTHGGKLHKCNAPIDGGEAWNAAHWTETTVAAELGNKLDKSGGDMSGLLGLNGGYVRIGSAAGEYTFLNFRGQLCRGSGIENEIVPDEKMFANIVIATPPQVRNLTLQSGFLEDEGTCTFFKTQENVVFLAGGVAGTLPALQLTQIGTLPANFCPVVSIRRDATTDKGTAFVEIRTDGTVWIYPFATATRCWFSAPFETGMKGEA